MCSGFVGSTATLGSLLGNGSSQSSLTLADGSPVATHSNADGEFGGVFWVTNGVLASSASSPAAGDASAPRTTMRAPTRAERCLMGHPPRSRLTPEPRSGSGAPNRPNGVSTRPRMAPTVASPEEGEPVAAGLEGAGLGDEAVDAHRPQVFLWRDEGDLLEAGVGEPAPDGRGEVGVVAMTRPHDLGPRSAELR